MVLQKAQYIPNNSYCSVTNAPFGEKVLNRAVAAQPQRCLKEASHTDPLQSGLRPGLGTESALVVLADYLHKERGSARERLVQTSYLCWSRQQFVIASTTVSFWIN